MTSASTLGRPAIGAGPVSRPGRARLERCAAADAAARRGVEVPLQPIQVHRDARLQLDADHVARSPVLHMLHLVGGLDDPLGEQEPDGQLAVVAGRAHRHRDPAADATAVLIAGQADLQRLLHRQLVGLHGRIATVDAPHQERGDGRVIGAFEPVGAGHGTRVPGCERRRTRQDALYQTGRMAGCRTSRGRPRTARANRPAEECDEPLLAPVFGTNAPHAAAGAKRGSLRGGLDHARALESARHEPAQDRPGEPDRPARQDVTRVMDAHVDTADADQKSQEHRHEKDV